MNSSDTSAMHQPKARDELDVSRMKEGANAVWAELVRKYHRLVVYIVRDRNVPADDVDDVAQEVWLKAYQRRGTFRAPETPVSWDTTEPLMKAWLVVIANSCAIDYHRRRIHDVLGVKYPVNDAIPAPEEITRLLVDWVDGLTDEEEQLIRLRCAGFTYDEIAKQLQKPLTTVYAAVQEVRRKLRPES